VRSSATRPVGSSCAELPTAGVTEMVSDLFAALDRGDVVVLWVSGVAEVPQEGVVVVGTLGELPALRRGEPTRSAQRSRRPPTRGPG
jgi:hypothetical protein